MKILKNIIRTFIQFFFFMFYLILGLPLMFAGLFAGDSTLLFNLICIIALTVLYMIWKTFFEYELQDDGEDKINDKNDADTRQPAIIQQETTCRWRRSEVIFCSGDFVTGRWDRDSFGNIVNDNAETHDAAIMSYLTRGKKDFYAWFRIKYSGLQLEQGEINWFRFNGSRYATVSIELGRVLSGPFEIYYPGGALKKSGFLIRGRPDGRLKTYHNDGRIKRLLNYKNGVREGNYEIFAANGEVIETGAYEAGKLSGYVLKYYEHGGLKEEIYYKRGIALLRTTYKPGGMVDQDRVSDAMLLAGAKDEELKSYKRLARVREKLGKYGLEINRWQSPMFPRERGIKQVGSQYNLREFSCEEELIKSVLDKEKFSEILERLEESRSGKFVVRRYNKKGKLIIER